MHSRKFFAAVNIISVLSILLGLWTILALLPCQTTANAAAGAATQDVLPLQVMNFNIRYGTANDGENRWENRRELVFDLLRRHKSDVVGLQEALRFQIDEIREALPQYNELGVARDDGGTKGEYCAILYDEGRLSVDESATFWFSETPEVPGSSHWGNACVRICTWARFIERKSGRAFYFFNLHLDHVSQPSREKSAVLLAKRIHDRKYPDPFIVTGDFNVGEDNPVTRYLKGKASLGAEDEAKSTNPVPMVDTFRVLHPDAVEVGTFNGFKGRRDGEKIDYIFTQPGAIVLDAQILRSHVDGRYPSDHFPVIATLRLGPAGRAWQGQGGLSAHQADQSLGLEQIAVAGGMVELEFQGPYIFLGPVMANVLDERGDLPLRAKSCDCRQFIVQIRLRCTHTQRRRHGKIAINRIGIDIGHAGQGLTQLGPDVAGRVEQADEKFLIDDAMIRVQIIPGGQKALGGLDVSKMVGEAILQPREIANCQRSLRFGRSSAAVLTQPAVRKIEPNDISLRYT